MLNSDKRYTVFISSTFIDLKEERAEIAAALTRFGMIPTGMELFPASSSTLLDTIKTSIKEADYYIIISANRYGTIYKGISYTEYEYKYATSLRKKPLAFLNENYSQEHSDNPKQLENFKKNLSKDHTTQYYNSTSDLCMKLIQSLNDHIKKNPVSGWVRDWDANRVTVHTDQVQRRGFYRDMTCAAREKCFIFGTTLAHVSVDHDELLKKLHEGVELRLMGLDPQFTKSQEINKVLSQFLSKAVDSSDDRNVHARVCSGFKAVKQLLLKAEQQGVLDKIEYRVYSYIPSSNMTMIDWDSKEGRLIFEHISPDNQRLTFPNIYKQNKMYSYVSNQFINKWAEARMITASEENSW